MQLRIGGGTTSTNVNNPAYMDNVFMHSFDRPNLSYEVIYCDDMTETQEINNLLKKLEQHLHIKPQERDKPETADGMRSALSLDDPSKTQQSTSKNTMRSQKAAGSCIIYGHSKKAVADLAGKLSSCGINAAPYHAGMTVRLLLLYGYGLSEL